MVPQGPAPGGGKRRAAAPAPSPQTRDPGRWLEPAGRNRVSPLAKPFSTGARPKRATVWRSRHRVLGPKTPSTASAGRSIPTAPLSLPKGR